MSRLIYTINMSDEAISNIETAQTENSVESTSVPEKPAETPPSQTAQIPPSEPLVSEPIPEIKQGELESISKLESIQASELPTAQIRGDEPLAPEPEPITPQTPTLSASVTHNKQELLSKARISIQNRKRKKLDKILEALNIKGKITNDEVEKLLHVSDATATRYLSILKQEGKIKQEGRTGKGVSYSRI